ncbi:MAG TPA: hypothetical protein PKD85_00285 [Saprospiraceae bacterium]|nr:hypothetical protein [Saprospiraceae bacterium]
MLELIILALVIFLIWHHFSSKKEGYSGLPDPCVHMMETGFSQEAVQACSAYAKRCSDDCEPYPVLSQEVTDIYSKLGVGQGHIPTAKDNAIAISDLTHDGCPTGLGPGNPCTQGEEECPYPYKCGVSSGKCECPSNPYYN